MRIIINGVGIAGPTLAYWLRRAGQEVLLVEAAPQLRRGGYVIDFGLVGYDIAEKMGLIPRLRELGYQVRELRFVDRRGSTCASMSVDALARLTHDRYITLRRSDLAATIYAALDGTVETLFGDSVASIEEAGACMRVRFDHAPPREADLVIGADGLHSRVRQLMFEPDTGVEVSLGYHVAAFELEGYRPRDELVYVGYGVPGRQIYRFSMREDKTLFLFVFRDEYLPAESSANDQERKSVLTNVFADVGWECPQILAALARVGSIYFDRASQIQLDR
jgi:2-polyprenyl-6-methoxyphenol hydroxylase-like FAD-dependent oxidoreductase